MTMFQVIGFGDIGQKVFDGIFGVVEIVLKISGPFLFRSDPDIFIE